MNDEQLYGFSLELDGSDIVFEGDGLAFVTGKANLLQALIVRLQTPFGSDRFNVTYGLDIAGIFSSPGTVRMVKELIKLNLVRTLSTDPRVRDIREVSFPGDVSPLDDAVRGERLRRTWRVEVLVDTVQDQAVTLTTQIGV